MKLLLRGIAVIVVLIVVVSIGLMATGTVRLARAVEVADHLVPDPASSPATLQEGRRLADAFVCTECHGAELEGKDFLDGGPFMRLPAPNLTGGLLSAEAFERAVRHGIGSDGRPLIIMPSEAFVDMADEDLAALSGYVASLPRVETPLMERSVGPIGRAVAAFQAETLQPARRIEHPTVHVATTVGAGERFGALCATCHGADFGGQEFVAEQAYWAANLTSHPTGASSWRLADFAMAVQQGRTPDGRQLEPSEMPWRGFARLSEAEIEEIWLFLRSQPPVDRPRPAEYAIHR